MINKVTAIDYLQQYLHLFPGENDRCRIFADYLEATGDAELHNRKNFNGHITTSAFIVNLERQELLLLKHKSLNRWLQPGGHVEGDTTWLASAIREAEEETGIRAAQMSNIAVIAGNEVPFDIDSHYIPANPKKQEDGHYHHDLRYLLAYTGDGQHTHNEDEATGLKWVSFNELTNDETFGGVVQKIRAHTALQNQ